MFAIMPALPPFPDTTASGAGTGISMSSPPSSSTFFQQHHQYHHHHRPAISSPLSSSPMRHPSSSPPAQPHAQLQQLQLEPPSSPLASRDPNASRLPRHNHHHRATQSSPLKPSSSSKPATSSSLFRYAAREARPNPLVKRREAAQEGRRRLFLSDVRRRSDDGKWEKRGGENEILKLEWWRLNRELQQAKNADYDGVIFEEELEELEDGEENDDDVQLPNWRQQQQEPRFLRGDVPVDLDDVMLDALEQEEEAEIDAFLQLSSSSSHRAGPFRPDSPHFSDDEDYDSLFADLILQQSQGSQGTQSSQGSSLGMALSQDVEMT